MFTCLGVPCADDDEVDVGGVGDWRSCCCYCVVTFGTQCVLMLAGRLVVMDVAMLLAVVVVMLVSVVGLLAMMAAVVVVVRVVPSWLRLLRLWCLLRMWCFQRRLCFWCLRLMLQLWCCNKLFFVCRLEPTWDDDVVDVTSLSALDVVDIKVVFRSPL